MKYNYDIENYIPYLRAIASKAEFILEIGPAKGDGSTKAFIEGLTEFSENTKKKLMISVDIRDYMEEKPTVDFWHLVIGDSREVTTLDAVLKISGKRFPDIIFIDTHHTYDQMKAELSLWKKMASPETTWLFHDTYMMGEYNHMTDAIKEYAKENGFLYQDVFSNAHGLGMMKGNNDKN